MAFSGYLIKLGGSNGNELPMQSIAAESYSATPDQRLEAKAARAATGVLYRATCSHKATKIEIETVPMTNRDLTGLMSLIASHFSDSNQRKIDLQYYDNETDAYKTGTFYMPDVQYKILRVEGNTIYYDSIRLAFIEY